MSVGSWAVRMAMPSIALLVCRWGGWPGWTPLLLRGFTLNPTIDFLLLADAPPAPEALLPRNVRNVPLTLDALLARLRSTVGCTLKTLRASGTFASGPSAAKTNDLKPMFGVAFADLLQPYDWWGYLQEDLLVGDLRAFATDALLARTDVICPYLPPLNASGVLMLFRNAPHVTNLWRKSAAARRVLSEPRYLVFDEWWGALARDDNFARVLGREASAGRIRLHLSAARGKWMADDKFYPREAGASVTTNANFVACWAHGKLWSAAGSIPTPCSETGAEASSSSSSSSRSSRSSSSISGGSSDGRGQASSRAEASFARRAEVAVVHFSRLKRRPWLANLKLDANWSAVREADSFALTADALWLPEPACEDNTTWANRYGLGCVGYEAEGHCANGAAVRGHEWALGAPFQWPERACCACGKRRHEREPLRQRERRTLWMSGLLPSSNRLSASRAGVTAHVRALGLRDAAVRCNPKKQKAPCPAIADAPEPPCVRVERGDLTAAHTLGARQCAQSATPREVPKRPKGKEGKFHFQAHSRRNFTITRAPSD